MAKEKKIKNALVALLLYWFLLPPQWRRRDRRIRGEDESRLSRQRKAFRYPSIVPQPPGGRGDQRHCGAARGSKGWLLLATPWSGFGSEAPDSYLARPFCSIP